MTLAKSIAFAATLALASTLAQASTQATPAAPAAGAPKADPAKFAEHKAALQARRAKTDACIAAAADGKALRECVRGEHEAMREHKADHKASK